jgi:hypothetical protein
LLSTRILTGELGAGDAAKLDVSRDKEAFTLHKAA